MNLLTECAKRGEIEFFEEELFRARIPLPPEGESTKTDKQIESKTKARNIDRDIDKDIDRDIDKDIDGDIDEEQRIVLQYCMTAKSAREIFKHLGLRYNTMALRRILHPLLESGRLRRTVPDKPTSRHQRYATVTSVEGRK